MARMGNLIAFEAAIELLKENNKSKLIDEVYQECLKQIKLPKEQVVNVVKKIYDQFTAEQISNKIAQLLTPKEINAKVEIIYQSIDGLHEACPNNTGDWYFTGNYPTPGGNKVACKAFINYVEGSSARAY